MAFRCSCQRKAVEESQERATFRTGIRQSMWDICSGRGVLRNERLVVEKMKWQGSRINGDSVGASKSDGAPARFGRI